MKEPSPRLGIMFQKLLAAALVIRPENVELAVKQVFPGFKGLGSDGTCESLLDHGEFIASHREEAELGGMRQRALLARTLSMQPEILLLDELLSALDALTRGNIQDEIIRIWEQDRRTIVMITNDVDEAVLMADRIVPLTKAACDLDEGFEVGLARPRNRTTLNTKLPNSVIARKFHAICGP